MEHAHMVEILKLGRQNKKIGPAFADYGQQ
jgi:hypothetical protein